MEKIHAFHIFKSKCYGIMSCIGKAGSSKDLLLILFFSLPLTPCRGVIQDNIDLKQCLVMLARLFFTLFGIEIPFYKLLDIAFDYHPLNFFLQGEALFYIMPAVLVEYVEFPGGASVWSYLHKRGILDKLFTLDNGKDHSDDGVERSEKPLRIYQTSMIWSILVLS